MAQRQAVRLAAALRARGRRCRPRSARRARSGRPRSPCPSRRRSMVTAPLWPSRMRLDAAAHARSAAERRDRRVGAAGPVEHGRDLLLVARIGDDVGRVRVVAREAAREVGIGLAVGVRGAVVVIGWCRRRARRARSTRGASQRDLVEARRAARSLEASRRTALRARDSTKASSSAVRPSPSRPQPKCLSRACGHCCSPGALPDATIANARPEKSHGARSNTSARRRSTSPTRRAARRTARRCS